jgi:hypothetical protein
MYMTCRDRSSCCLQCIYSDSSTCAQVQVIWQKGEIIEDVVRAVELCSEPAASDMRNDISLFQ